MRPHFPDLGVFRRAAEPVQRREFRLVGVSEVNANPRDTKDYPLGVWALPPTYAAGDTDRAKYAAIGESDRFTLRFRKPLAPPATAPVKSP